MQITEKQRQGLAAIDAFLEVFSQRYKKRRLTIRCIEVFMHVAIRPGQTYQEIAQSMNIEPNLAYNDVAQLTDINTSGAWGLSLIEFRKLMHIERRELWLTPKGEDLWVEALSAWEYGLRHGVRIPIGDS